MSLNSAVLDPDSLAALDRTNRDFHTEFSSLDHLVQELFQDLDRAREELAQQSDELAQQRTLLATRSRELAQKQADSSQLADQLILQNEQLQLARQEIQELRNCQAANTSPPAEFGPTTLAPDSLNPILEEISALRVSLAATRDELTAAIQQAAEQQQNSQYPENLQLPASSPDDETTLRLAEAEQDRAELESELELVRGRAVELNNTVEIQKRELADQQHLLASELKQLRRLVEDQAELLAHHQAAAKSIDPGPPARQSSAGLPLATGLRKSSLPAKVVAVVPVPAVADPVVNSVMAQFAKLQKDVASRRKKK